MKEIRSAGSLDLANYSACQDVLRRVEKTFKAFLRRVKAGQKAGYPRFKSRRRFDSYTFPSYGDGCRLTGTRLYLQGVGHIKVKLHRPVEGAIKTISVKRACGKWYACFSVEYAAESLPASETCTGIDVGLDGVCHTADGTAIENPRHYQRAQAKLRLAQRRVARRQRGGNNRRKAVLLLQKAHAKIKNQRADFQHKVARTLVNTYGVIAVEDLHIKGLASGMLAKSVNDAGWSGFHHQACVQSGRGWAQVGTSRSSWHEPGMSLWGRSPQDAGATLAPVPRLRIVGCKRSCLGSTYLRARTEPVRVNVVVVDTSVPNEAACLSWRSSHTAVRPGDYHRRRPNRRRDGERQALNSRTPQARRSRVVRLASRGGRMCHSLLHRVSHVLRRIWMLRRSHRKALPRFAALLLLHAGCHAAIPPRPESTAIPMPVSTRYTQALHCLGRMIDAYYGRRQFRLIVAVEPALDSTRGPVSSRDNCQRNSL